MIAETQHITFGIKLEIRSVEQGICPIATLYSLAAAYKGLGANRAQLSFTGAKL